jgi:hypothetical protein
MPIERNEKGYTPSQQRLIDVLSDGLPHDREELRQALGDDQLTNKNLSDHIILLRRVVRPRGEEIVCELWDGSPHYRHVRFLIWPLPVPIPKQCQRKVKPTSS